MDYLVKITNQETHKVLSLYVLSEIDLTNEQIENIKKFSNQIFADYDEKTNTKVNIVDLENSFKSIENVEEGESPFLATVRKMKVVGPVKHIHRSCGEIYRRLVEKKPSFPLKFTWDIFIAPFIVLYRFITQDRHLSERLHKVFGTEMGTQKQFLSQLKRTKERIFPKNVEKSEKKTNEVKEAEIKEEVPKEEGKEEVDAALKDENLLEKEEKEALAEEEKPLIEEESITELEKILDEAYQIGTELLNFSNSKNPNLDEVVDPIASRITDKISADQEEQMLGMIPVSLTIEGKKTPLMISFRKEKDGVYVEIKGLIPGKNGGLHDSFKISLDKTEKVIPSIIKALFQVFLADVPKKTEVHISRRERIRLNNLELLGFEPFAEKGPQSTPSTLSAWLNEMLCNLAIPVESNEGLASKKEEDLLLKTVHTLETCFPDSPTIDKIEWVLASVEEECESLLSTIDRLKPSEQIYFFEKLEDNVQQMQKRLSTIKKDETESVFNVFFNRLEAVKEKRSELQEKIQKSQLDRLSSKVVSQKKCKTQALLPDTLRAFKSKKNSKVEKKEVISAETLQKITALKTSIARSEYQNALDHLKALHAIADKYIDKKQYLLAQELAVLTLKVLPVPNDNRDSFWSRTHSEDAYSEVVTALVKDVWESSLRLNYTHLQPEQIIPLFKAQAINQKLLKKLRQGTNQIDVTELKKIIHIHPHLRFGWKPAQLKELKEIHEYIETLTDPYCPRRDGEIRSTGGVYPQMQRKSDGTKNCEIDFVRLQVMVTSLMKPDHCFYPFYGAGRLEQAQGLSWLDELEAKAIANGAKTRQEIEDEMRVIRLKVVQDRMKSMGRLELGLGRFVTEFDCVTLVDGSSLIQSSVLAYLPNGLGLPPDYEAKYGSKTNQKNTRGLVGFSRGQECFLGERDDQDIASGSGLKDCLSPQLAYTEPTLLQTNLQKPPRGQVSQVENYLLESVQLGKISEIAPGSIVEGLNVLFSDRNLADPEVQKTVLLALTRSFLLEQALKDFPREMDAIAHQLLKLIQEKSQDPLVFPFLLQVGQIIQGYAASLDGENDLRINRIAAVIPSFDHEITIGDSTQSGEKWLESILKDPEKDRSLAAIAYLYSMMDRPVNEMSKQTISLVLFSASFFGTVADTLALPQFNRMVEKWINETVLPELGVEFQKADYPLDEVFGKWMEQAHPIEFASTPSPWRVTKREPVTVENGRIKVVLSTLQTISKETKKPIGVPKVTIPEHIRRSSNFLKLFGGVSPKAELTREDDPNQFVYTFHYGKMNASYKAVYDQTSGHVDIYSLLPVNPQKKHGAKEWFLYIDDFKKGDSETTLEKCIYKQGIWVNAKKPKKGYFISVGLSEARRNEMYSLSLNGKGQIEEAKSVKGNRKVALLSPEQTEAIAPFVNGAETLVLLSSWPFRKIREIRSLDQKYNLKNVSGKWNFEDSRFGESLEWNVDLSKQYQESLQGTHEKRFFEQLGSDHQQFLIPFSQGKERQFLLLPYEISPTAKQGLSFDKESLDPVANQIPITLSFGEEGEIKGSPSTFLYLSYYYCMKKDYDRALFYLKKAKQVPAQSELEKAAFEQIAALFDQVPYHAFSSLVFQLKAQLAIREIKKTQFSRTIYERENEAGFVTNTAHVTQLYRLYQDKLKNLSKEQAKKEKLKEEEEFILQRIEWSSFSHWIDKQKDKDLAARSGEKKLLPVEDKGFLSTKLDQTWLDNFSKGILSTVVLLAKDLDRNFSDDELVKNRVPEAEFLVRHFFHYALNIQSGSSEKILNYLLTIPQWQLTPPKHEEEQEIAQIAEELRSLLIFFCVNEIKNPLARNPNGESIFSLNAIKNIKDKLPYWGRQNFLPIRFVLNNIDLQSRTASNIQGNLSTFEYVIQGLFASLRGYAGQTIGEILETIPKRNREEEKKKEQETGGVTMEAIYEHFKSLSGEHFYLPLETTEIPRLIEEETADKMKARDMATYYRESESRNFPILQIRNLAETMREIEKCEKALAEQEVERSKVNAQVVKLDPQEMVRIKTALKDEARGFSELSDADKVQKDEALADLERKYTCAKKYFNPEKTQSPAAKEEFDQLCLGFEAAREKLKEELEAKSHFTKEEIKALEDYLKKHVENPQNDDQSLVKLYETKKEVFLNKVKNSNREHLPRKLCKMLDKPDLYTDFDLMHAVQKIYKDPQYASFFAASEGEWDQLMTETFLLMAAYQQFRKAYQLLTNTPGESSAKKALEFIQGGVELDRYFDADGNMSDPLVFKSMLVGEARGKIVYRKGQRKMIEAVAEDPQQWLSLRMGEGKTSFGIPTIADILAQQGKAVVFTVPDKLLKSNRKDVDKSTRELFDQAGMEFSLPLAQDLPFNFLAEKLLQIQQVFKDKGYVITTVEELATLHDTCILCEEEKRQIVSRAEGGRLSRDDEVRLFHIELRLHYYRKITRLLNGEATELRLPTIFFGDETDDTHHITHEVSIAIAEQIDPSKPVREVSRTIMEHILSSGNESVLNQLKKGLREDTYSVLTEADIQGFMGAIAKDFLHSNAFLNLIHPDHIALIQGLDPEEWSAFIIGQSDQLPRGLPEWDGEDEAWIRTQTIIASTKQILTSTLPNFLSQKSGNDLGLSDFLGFIVVPKMTKNETEGIRYGDEFEMILAQYIGYLEFLPCLSLTDKSTDFLAQALKTLREKSPVAYRDLLADYHTAVERLRTAGKEIPELFEYLQSTEAFKHRWNILDNVVFDSGYIKRYKEQVNVNVQEIFHGKPSGGVTGTLDPYVLPYISDDILLHRTKGKKTSTREVETETFLRMGMNLAGGLDTPTLKYADDKAEERLEEILLDKETKALINSNGATSEGMNTLKWIEKIRKSSAGAKRSYLFMHPAERIPYLWTNASSKPVPYKGQSLPDNTICVYAPSDVRGVDLPIRKGKVHMLVNSTASPQELVQSLYRARQLGGDHQLIMHVPLSLSEKILEQKEDKTEATYGNVLVYLVNRAIPGKLELDLTAQLKKVQFELKTAVTSYLKEINPDFDKTDFWSKENLDRIGFGAVAQATLFEKLRDFYIQSKDIDFGGCYTPREFIGGPERVLDEYAAVQKRIRDLLNPIKEASLISAGVLMGGEDQSEKLTEEFDEKGRKLITVLNEAREVKAHPAYDGPMRAFIIGRYQLSDLVGVFDQLAEVHLSVDKCVEELETLPPEEKGTQVEKAIGELRGMERWISELIYGKGKSHFYNTLRKIDTKIESARESFNRNKEEHKKYLPEKTTKNRVGCAGTNEQVKEMQQQKTKEVEKTEEDPTRLTAGAQRGGRSYQSFDRYAVVGGEDQKELRPLSPLPPFSDYLISPEAKALLDTLTMMTGDPLVYIAVDTSKDVPRITLLSKTDYHKVIKEQFKYKYDSWKRLAIYQPTPSGFRWVSGGKKTSYRNDPPEEIMNALMTIKAYLGYKDEFATDSSVVKAWRQSLSVEAKKGILQHVANKGSPAQRKIFQDLIGD